MPRTAILGRSSSSFFEALKSEERHQFPSRKRLRTEYRQNFSAAETLASSNAELGASYQSEEAVLSMASSHIIEHANRRVDLFFYTLIAYYLTGLNPTNGHTSLQHGKGRHINADTAATVGCHSSFTPSLLDETIYQNRPYSRKRKSLVCHTHFMDSLNATMELPPFVNQLDELIEGACRPKCMKILTAVSYGKINPIEGLTLFLQMMKEFLDDLEAQAEHDHYLGIGKHSFFTNDALNQNLIHLVMKGTLSTTFVNWTKTVSEEYLQMLLRLTPAQKRLCNEEQLKERIYLAAIRRIQTEILTPENKTHVRFDLEESTRLSL